MSIDNDADTLGKIAVLLGGKLDPKYAPTQVKGGTLTAQAVGPGIIFVAISGTKADGHAFLPEAFARGCAAAVVLPGKSLAGGGPCIEVNDTRRAASTLADFFCGSPSRQLKLVGVTGTNGKTTVQWLIYHALNALGAPAIRVGTLGSEIAGAVAQAGVRTTPDAFQLHDLFRRAVSAGCLTGVMETSSHALDQARVEEVAFDVGVFTNLTRDHLDYHQTMERYFAAKRHLFELIAAGRKSTRAAVICADDEYGTRLIEEVGVLGLRDLSYGRSRESKIRIESFEHRMEGSTLVISYDGKSYTVPSQFLGWHNAGNLAAAFGALVALGFSPDRIVEALSRAPAVPGRLECVHRGKSAVFVDYAHTPDALEKALTALRPLTSGKLWVVFGCGGDRDAGKRPVMADLAAKLADHVVVTSDNPRTEDPDAIIGQVLSGESGSLIRRSGIIEVDRRLAIKKALGALALGDVLLIAGKGHEDYQIMGTTKFPFSDQDEVRAYYAGVTER